MSTNIKPINLLVVECIKDVRWELHQIRSRIRTDEVYRLAEALFYQKPIEWPYALLELQRGITINRLRDHVNFHVRKFGFSPERELVFHGPFPALSLTPLLAKVGEQRVVVRTAQCFEFLGNKAWDHALKPIKKTGIPFKVEVGTVALDTFGCSPKQQIEVALADLVERIKGHIINFLCDWEALLIRQIREQLSVCRADFYLPISEAAV
ncbi:MAG: hypothetical protein K0R55_1782 [Sporomusa sp.]|nr:hypothetical protein [Sporomusa sp.]